MTAPHTTVAPTSTPPTTPATTKPTTQSPSRPTVPADVPRTGPNTRKGEKPPVMPLAATKHTAAGAQAFAEFFIKTIDWGYAVVDGSYAAHYSSRHCVDCFVFVRGMDKARRLKHTYIGGRITVTSGMLARKPTIRSAEYTAVLTFDILAFAELTQAGRTVRADQAHSGEKFEVSVAWREHRWMVVKLAADR
jgi:hypothetical protein